MPLKAGERYEATIKDAFLTESKAKGTAGLFMSYETPSGTITHTWWITPGTSKRLADTLATCFGVTQENLQNDAFLESIGDHLRGRSCSITTEAEETERGERVVVKWMNASGYTPKKVTGASVKRIASIFGGGPVSSPAVKPPAGSAPAAGSTADWGITDEDVPF